VRPSIHRASPRNEDGTDRACDRPVSHRRSESDRTEKIYLLTGGGLIGVRRRRKSICTRGALLFPGTSQIERNTLHCKGLEAERVVSKFVEDELAEKPLVTRSRRPCRDGTNDLNILKSLDGRNQSRRVDPVAICILGRWKRQLGTLVIRKDAKCHAD